jgi:hypothetical protein
MRITRNDASVLELRGRQEDKEQGAGGLWLVFVVGLSFLVMSAFWLWDEISQGSPSFASLGVKVAVIMAIALGVAGALLVAFGVILALKRESLTIDLTKRTGVYRRWRLPWGEMVSLEFGLAQIGGVDVHKRVETICNGDGPPNRYLKWDARLHIAPATIIPLCRSSNRVKVDELADQVCRALGLKLLNGEPT